MSSSPRATRPRTGPLRWIAAAAAGLLVVAGCGSAGPSASPPPSSSATASAATAAPSASLTASPSPTPSASTEPGWQSIRTMSIGRMNPQVVRLSDGRVFVVGTELEVNANEALTTELFDPVAGTWSAGPALPKARHDAVLVALLDGRALIAGGLNDERQSYSSAYVFGPKDNSLTKVGLLGTARAAAAGAVLRDGRVLIAGGYFSNGGTAFGPAITLAAYRPEGTTHRLPPDDVEPNPIGPAMATAELFDPATGEWTKTGSMAFARFGFGMVALSDGRVLAVGSSSAHCCGVAVDGDAYDTAEIYDPATGQWSSAGRLPELDRAAVQKRGKADANPIPTDPPEPETGGRLVALPDGGALLVADHRGWKHVGETTRSFRFDAAAGSWTEVGPPYVQVGEPGPVEFETADVANVGGWTLVPLPDGSFFAVEPFEGAVGRYDPTTATLAQLPPPPVAKRFRPGVVDLADGSVVVIGGGLNTPDGNITALGSVDRFVP